MDIKFHCKSCGQRIVVDAAGEGMTIPCPKCQASLTIPKAADAELVHETMPTASVQPSPSTRETAPPASVQPSPSVRETVPPPSVQPSPSTRETAPPITVQPGTTAAPKIPAKPSLAGVPDPETKGRMRRSAVVQCILWLICLAVLVIGGALFCLALSGASAAPQQEAAAAVFATCIIGAYVLARVVEKICNLIDRK